MLNFFKKNNKEKYKVSQIKENSSAASFAVLSFRSPSPKSSSSFSSSSKPSAAPSLKPSAEKLDKDKLEKSEKLGKLKKPGKSNKASILLFALNYTLSLLLIAFLITLVSHSKDSIADGNRTKEQIEHAQFIRLSLRAKVNITSKNIKEAFKSAKSYKKLNREILYESNSIVNSVIGWNAGPIDGGKTFYLSLPTPNANQCSIDKVEVLALTQVQRVDCRPGKMFVIFKPEDKNKEIKDKGVKENKAKKEVK